MPLIEARSTFLCLLLRDVRLDVEVSAVGAFDDEIIRKTIVIRRDLASAQDMHLRLARDGDPLRLGFFSFGEEGLLLWYLLFRGSPRHCAPEALIRFPRGRRCRRTQGRNLLMVRSLTP
jgi:hypothetical protein